MTMDTMFLDTGRMTGFTCASPPEPMLEYQSTEPRKDRDSGLPLYLVGVTVRNKDARKAWVIDVQVPGEPVGITEGTIVKLSDLSASPWDRDGRSGVTYRASAISPANGPAPTPAPAGPSAADTSAARRTTGDRAAGS
jgi:hypothetical protein